MKIEDHATIKVPGNWKQGEKNGLIYFYDPNLPKDDNVVLFQTNMLYDMFYVGSPIEIDEGSTEQNIISNRFQRVVTLTGTVNSLGSSNGKALVCVDNNTKIIKCERHKPFALSVCKGIYRLYICRIRHKKKLMILDH